MGDFVEVDAIAGVSLTVETTLGRLISVLTGFSQGPVLIDNAEEVNGDVAELLSNGHDSMLTSASPVVNVVSTDGA